MKELSIEEKAKAYDEALKVIKGCNPDENGFITIYPQEIFPELKVSDDERICNGLIKLLNCIAAIEYENTIGITKEEALEWVKRQGENAYNEELSKLLHKVICHFINNPDIPYSKRAEVSKKVIPYVEKLEKQGEQKPIACSDGTVDNSLEGIIDAAIYWGKEAPTENGRIPEDKMKGAVDYYCSLIRNNDGWSEEDEEIHIKCICAMRASACGFPEEEKFVEQVDNWLKSLKDRVLPQQEWSDEDERIRQDIENLIHFALRDGSAVSPAADTTKEDAISWIQSLRPQNRWKPSDGQLECLGYAIEKAEKDWSPLTNNRIYLTLKALKEQLKKLRDE